MKAVRQAKSDAGGRGSDQRSILDSKVWVNVKNIGGEPRTGFREWNEKFRNAFLQVRPHIIQTFIINSLILTSASQFIILMSL